jgi:hypothetical protein
MNEVAAIGVEYCAIKSTTLKLDNVFKDFGQALDDESGEVLFQIQCASLSGKRKLVDFNGNEIAQMYSQATKRFYVTVSSSENQVMSIKPRKMQAVFKNLCNNGQSTKVDIVGDKRVVIGLQGGRKLASLVMTKTSLKMNIQEGVDMAMIVLLAIAYTVGNKEDTICCLCSEILGDLISLG